MTSPHPSDATTARVNRATPPERSSDTSASSAPVFGGWKVMARSVAADVIPPLLLLALLKALGMSDVIAYTAGAGVPGVRMLVDRLRGKPFSVISALVAALLILSVVLAVTTQDVRVVMARGALLYGLVAIAFGISLVAGRPVMFQFTKYYAVKADPAAGPMLEQRYRTSPQYRSMMRTATVVWIAGFLCIAVACATAAFTLPMAAAAILNNLLEPLCALALAAWSRQYMKRRLTAGMRATD